MNVLVAVLGLAFLILIHEAGHFAVARAVRMRPRKFIIFFPPILLRREWGGTEIGIGAIPLGGYVKIPGMHRPAAADADRWLEPALAEAPGLSEQFAPLREALVAERLDEARGSLTELWRAFDHAELTQPAHARAKRGLTELDDALSEQAYWRAPTWKRVAVIGAGPGVNLLFALLALALVFMTGVPVGTTGTVDSVLEGSPAEAIGLRPDDRVLGVAGRDVAAEAISRRIRASKGSPITLTVERAGRLLELGPGRARLEQGRYRLGFALVPTIERKDPAESFLLATRAIWAVTEEIGSALGRLVTGKGKEELASPVGIVQGSSAALDRGFRPYLEILAFISLSLALLNLLPLLPLDGGHVAFSVLEGIRGRAIPRGAYERASAVGLAIVLFLFFIGLSNDIGRLGGSG